MEQTSSNTDGRSLAWSGRDAPRYWWHRLLGMNFVPPIYSCLTNEEWEIIRDWFDETDRRGLIGECAVPLMSLLHALITGNRIARIVQLGTHAGYSSLLLGFMLRRMNAPNGLLTFDIDADFCTLTERWLNRAGLTNFVTAAKGDSRDPNSVRLARELFAASPELIVLDSSHEYQSTLDELELWYPALQSSGFIVLHDVSEFASGFDVTKSGGVQRAFAEWRRKNPTAEAISINASTREMQPEQLAYKDACGVGLIHKPRSNLA